MLIWKAYGGLRYNSLNTSHRGLRCSEISNLNCINASFRAKKNNSVTNLRSTKGKWTVYILWTQLKYCGTVYIFWGGTRKHLNYLENFWGTWEHCHLFSGNKETWDTLEGPHISQTYGPCKLICPYIGGHLYGFS